MNHIVSRYASILSCALLAAAAPAAAAPTIHHLGTLGGEGSYGYAVNDAGQVTGYSWLGDFNESDWHAFRYDGTPGAGGVMRDLGTLGGTNSFATAINDAGQVLGWSLLTGNTAHHAFLYTGTPGLDGQMIDLDEWLDANNPAEGPKWTLREPLGLSDTGWITGIGNYDPDGPGGIFLIDQAFLRDASSLVPEPSGLGLLILGGLAILHRHRGFLARRQLVCSSVCTCTFPAILLCTSAASPALAAASLTPLGYLPGDLSSVGNSISSDGSVVVGTSGGYGGQAFRWTAAAGMGGLGRPLGDFYSYARAVNGDGSVVVGGSDYADDKYYRIQASRWTAAGGMQSLGHLPGGGFTSVAVGVSGDGSVVVGTSDSVSGDQAFRWTAAGGMQGLGDLPGGAFLSEANGVSADGSVIVGYGTSTSDYEAFRWTSAGGMVGLGFLPGDLSSQAYGVSADGSIVVGTSSSISDVHIFRWTNADGMVGLGSLPGNFYPRGFSADGSVVVGYESQGTGPSYTALYWTADSGTQTLWDVLLSHGVDPAADGWSTLQFAKAISADGNTIVGDGIRNGRQEAFVAVVPEPAGLTLLAASGVLAFRRSRRESARAVATTAALTGVLLAPSSATATMIYNLGSLGGSSSVGHAVNDAGQVAGYSYTAGNLAFRAFRYDGTPGAGGVMRDLGTLGGSSSYGYGINDAGQVTGNSLPSGGYSRAFRYDGTPGSGGVMRNLGTLGDESLGFSVNNAGQVAGASFTGSGNYHAFRYDGTPGAGGVMRDLGTLGGTGSIGNGINGAGQVAGESSISGDTAVHAFRYDGTPGAGGVMRDLGTLGGTSSTGWSINNTGQVAGTSDLTDNVTKHAFRYDGTPGSGGVMHDLGTLGGSESWGYGINDFGHVVGRSTLADDAAGHAFLYTGTPGAGGQMIDLDTWLDANNPTEGAKWTHFVAYDISNTGWITGTGTYDPDGAGGIAAAQRAYLLDANSVVVPEPSSITLLGLALPALLHRRRKRIGALRDTGEKQF